MTDEVLKNDIGDVPSKDDVLKLADEESVKFVQLQFMDILGVPRSVSIPCTKLEAALDNGVIFDASSIVGYATIDESDMRLQLDLRTFQILPWTNGDMKTARLICNVHHPDGKRFEGDPRYILEKVMKKARDMGYIFNTGPEYEFFLFKTENGSPTTELSDRGGYFELMPPDKADHVRKEILNYLDAMGYDAEASHHEVAPSQHEIDLRYADAVTSSDRVFMLKFVIKDVATQHNLHATFMPKPLYGMNGSGMHVHQSLITPDGENAFYDPDGKHQLSEIAYHYLGGLLKYAKDICAIQASWVNSYKRLVPGYEAPVYISWANRNRSALIRVPSGRGISTRFELRNPDPAGNPYLQFAAMLGAGLKGIEENIEPPKAVERDIYKLSGREKKELGIDSLPSSLGHALACMEESTLMREVLGEHVFSHFLVVKNKDWDEYRTQVTPWEIEKYLAIL